MSVVIEMLKVTGMIGGVWLGGYIALERLIEEGRQASGRVIQAA